MDYIEISGYKSIRYAKVELKSINLLIGSNGSGKTNFISFFEFLNRLYDQKLREYIALNGGLDKMLHKGSKVTEKISARICFDDGKNEYSFVITKGDDAFVFTEEILWYEGNPWHKEDYSLEAKVKTDDTSRAKYVRKHLEGLKKYHFHDTGKNSPFNQTSHIENDSYFLYERGENLAAFLYAIQQQNRIIYSRIVKVIQSIAPYFSDFYFHPNTEGYIRLQWQDKYSSTIYGATDLSDGTIRFIALATLFMQPNLPSSIIIDEPELGLHPFAIAKLAGMIKSVANRGTQVILATQSTDLISHFQAEDILTVDQQEGETVFNRLATEDFSEWLEDYSLGDLWKRHIVQGGHP